MRARSTRCQSVYRLRQITRLSRSSRTSHPRPTVSVIVNRRVSPARLNTRAYITPDLYLAGGPPRCKCCVNTDLLGGHPNPQSARPDPCLQAPTTYRGLAVHVVDELMIGADLNLGCREYRHAWQAVGFSSEEGGHLNDRCQRRAITDNNNVQRAIIDARPRGNRGAVTVLPRVGDGDEERSGLETPPVCGDRV